MKLLIVDDNAAMAESMVELLGDAWRIKTTASGREGIKLAKSGNYSVIILDLNLPDINGHDVCRAIRRAGVVAPILVLTCIDEPDTKVRLFSYGADDYVTKPFDIKELHARLLALLRRGHFDPKAPHLLKIGTLILDPRRRHVERDGQPITLRRKEFDVLEYLMRNSGRVVTRAMIMDNVWAADSDSWDSTVDVHIKCLRDKVDRPFKRQLISTTYGVGYTINDRY